MRQISYKEFKELLNSYEFFEREDLNLLYSEYGEDVIGSYFDKYYQELSEKKMIEFTKKFSVYFDNIKVDLEVISDVSYNNDVIKMLINNAARYKIMTRDEEYQYSLDLKETRNELKIIKDKESISILYPNLDMAMILKSVDNSQGLKILRSIVKIPFKLEDDNILKNDIEVIKKYINLCKFGVLSYEELCSNFSEYDFDNVEKLSFNELVYQTELLKKYIVAKFNLYNRNLRLVVSLAKKFNYDSEMFADSIQEGNIGLVKAINKFDIDTGNRFSTYATWWIRQNMYRALDNDGEIIRKPVHLHSLQYKYKKFVDKYMLLNNNGPTDEEIMNALGISENTLENIKMVIMNKVISLDIPVEQGDNEDTTIGDFIASDDSVEDEVINNDMKDYLNEIISENLNERQQIVIKMRFGLNEEDRIYTLEEIGQLLGVTRERIRQIETKGMRILTAIMKREKNLIRRRKI